jgi:hypothetical protein
MALIIHYEPKQMNETKYREILKRLESAGAGAPRGRLHHACYGDRNALVVVDIFDTPANFEAFGKVIGPILGAVGVELPPPQVTEVCNIIRG